MVRKQQPRRSRRSARAPSRQHIVRTVQRTEMGRQLYPSTDPPNWSQFCWWPFTLTFTVKSDTQISAADLGLEITKSLGLPVETKVNVDNKTTTSKPKYGLRLRMQDVRIWGLARQPIMLNVYRLNKIGTVIKQLSDRGSNIAYSRLGWHFGMDSILSLPPDDPDVIFDVKGTLSDSEHALVYVRVLLQFDTTLEPKEIPQLTKLIPQLTKLVSPVAQSNSTELSLDSMVLE